MAEFLINEIHTTGIEIVRTLFEDKLISDICSTAKIHYDILIEPEKLKKWLKLMNRIDNLEEEVLIDMMQYDNYLKLKNENEHLKNIIEEYKQLIENINGLING